MGQDQPQAVVRCKVGSRRFGGLASVSLALGLVLHEMDHWRVLGREQWGLLYSVLYEGPFG